MTEEQTKHQCSLSAHDLRIGNWVYDGKHTKYPMQVVAIGKDWAHLDFPGNEGGVWEADINDLQPIKLTEAFLKKIGVTLRGYHGNGKHFCSADLRIEVFKTSDSLAVQLGDGIFATVFGKCLNYVHELQNAYYIAIGKELEVIL